MSIATCPVNNIIVQLEEIIDSSRLKDPKCRRIAEELLELLFPAFQSYRRGDMVFHFS